MHIKYLSPLIALFFCSLLPAPYQLSEWNVIKPSTIEHVSVWHHHKSFFIVDKDKSKRLQYAFVDPMLRHLTTDQVKGFVRVGYLKLGRMDDGTYFLRACVRMNGGGPVCGEIASSIIKILAAIYPVLIANEQAEHGCTASSSDAPCVDFEKAYQKVVDDMAFAAKETFSAMQFLP